MNPYAISLAPVIGFRPAPSPTSATILRVPTQKELEDRS